MKRSIRYALCSVAALLLAFITLCGGVAAQPSEGAVNPLHFGIVNDESNERLNNGELFAQLSGNTALAEETAYMSKYEGISFLYNDAVPDSVVGTVYNGEAGVLQLSVSPYTYVAANGISVCWLPQRATLGEQTVSFHSDGNDGYLAELTGLFHSADFDIQIDFTWSAQIPDEVANEVLSAPYTAAEQAHGVITAYEKQYLEWKTRYDRYMAYNAYLQSVAAYEQYLKDCDAYDQAVIDYAEYLEILELQRKFDEWAAYWAYDTYLKEKLELRIEYEKYLGKVKKVTDKLAVLENLFVTDSNGWQLYASLMGNTVTEVVARKDELVAAGASAADVDAAGAATVALRPLMEAYAALREVEYESDHARITALYDYYTAHYEEIKTQFTALYGALNALHGNSLVVAKLSSEGKLEHYRQFVGELYITRTTLDDSFTRKSDWSIGKLPLSSVVEAINIVPDRDEADPTTAQMPSEAVPEVEAMEPVTKPTYPQPAITTRPEVEPMDEPVKPTPVSKPSDAAPPAAEDPGPAPVLPTLDPAAIELAYKLRVGALPKRTVQAGQACTVSLSTTVTRRVSISNLMTVTFYAGDRKTKLQELTLEYGTPFSYTGAPPQKEDKDYIYTFRAWVTADGKNVEMKATKNMSLYPYYHTERRYYDVTWVLHDMDGTTKTQTKQLPYGANAICPFYIPQTATERYEYIFSGWDTEPAPVTGSITYTGTLTRRDRLYTVTWDLGERTETSQWAYGTVPSYEGTPARASDSYLYRFIGWDKALSPVHTDVTYTARYEKTPLAITGNGEVIEIRHSEDAVKVISSVNSAVLYEAARLAAESGKDLQLQYSQFVLTLPNGELEAMLSAGFRRVEFAAVDPTAGVAKARTDAVLADPSHGIAYEVRYLDSVGQPLEGISPRSALQLVTVYGTPGTALFVLKEGAWEPVEDARLEASGSFVFLLSDRYAITHLPAENCDLRTLPMLGTAGCVVDLGTVKCEFGYHIEALRVTDAEGREVQTNGLRFVMPRGGVTVQMTVIKTVYHVTFVVDGVVIAEADYFKGDKIEFPSDPEKASDELYDYIFRGWSSDMTLATGEDHNPVFEALFIQSDRNEVDPSVSTENNDRLLTVVLPIVAAVLVVCIPMAIILVKLYLKNKSGDKKRTDRAQRQVRAALAEKAEPSAQVPQPVLPTVEEPTVEVPAQTGNEEDFETEASEESAAPAFTDKPDTDENKRG